jgi:hypothetical protein
MAIPSIKGTAFQSAHDDVHALLTRRAITRAALEVALEARDLRLLEEKVSPSAWYPMDSYDRLLRLLCEKEARGRSEEYLIARGVKAGERIAATGIYQQLDTTTEALGIRTGRVVVSIAGLIFNFTSWHFEREGATLGHFSIRVEDAANFPEIARFTTQGFIQNAATRIVGRPMQATSERPLPSRILFHVEDAK